MDFYARAAVACSPGGLHRGLTWRLDDLCEPNDSEQPDSTAAEPLEGPPVPRRCCSHSSAGRISTKTHLLLSSRHLSHTLSPQAAPNKPPPPPAAAAAAASDLSAKLWQKKKTNPKKIPEKMSLVPPPRASSHHPADSELTPRLFTPPSLRVADA